MESSNPENGPLSCNEQIIDDAIMKLGEHFDSVHIFATLHDSQIGTTVISRGCGNWLTRYGQIKEWTIKQDEDIRQQ